jgi:hypothetical protein
MQKMSLWFKDHFIPHPGNDHKPHFLRHKSMLAVLSVVVIAEMAFLFQTLVIFTRTDMLAAVLPGVLTALTNENRVQNNVAPLVENSLLDEAAQMKANDMATNGYFAHTSPDGKTPWYWFQLVGYKYSFAGENLAVNFFDSADVAKAWMNSPEHRANIVRKDFTQIGIGVANGVYQGHNTVFVAQLFGTPAEAVSPEAPTAPVAKAGTTKTGTTASAPASAPTSSSASASAPVVSVPSASKIISEGGIVASAVTPTETKVLGDETTTNAQAQTVVKDSPVKLFIEKVLTSPGQYLSYIYAGIAFLVFIALMLAVFIKREIQHPKIILGGLGMIAIIALLAYVNFKVLNIQTQVPANAATASAIYSFQ